MGKLSAFWLAGAVASLSASATMAGQSVNDFGNIGFHGLSNVKPATLQPTAFTISQGPIATIQMNGALKAAKGYAKLDGALARIAEAQKTLPREQLLGTLKSSYRKARFSQLSPYEKPAVNVEIYAKGEPDSVRQRLLGLGIQHDTLYAKNISATVPVDRLTEIAALDGVASIRLSRVGVWTGSVSDQGDYVQSSYTLRSPYTNPGYTGAGYTVGVLSDSFDCAKYDSSPPVTDYAADVASGDLPANMDVIEPSDCNSGTYTDEGRAMAQIVYDIAPGVSLRFSTAYNGESDFANQIETLGNTGAQIIVDDVYYYDEPVFQEGLEAQAVDAVHDNNGVAYFSAAGNDARQSYEADWIDSGTQGLQGADNAGEELMALNAPDGSKTTVLPVFMPYPGEVIVLLQWDQPYASTVPQGSSSPGASSAMDICMIDLNPADAGYGQVIPGSCSTANPLGTDPIVGIEVDNPTNGAIEFGLQIGLAGGTAPHLLKVSFADDGLGTNAVPGFATYSGTITGHAAAQKATAVGASFYYDSPVCDPTDYPTFFMETYSSSGGDPILFDATGTQLATPLQLQKPAFIAPDGAATTFFGYQIGATPDGTPAGCVNGASSWNFLGTSAAGPHAAGMAALLWEAGPDQTNDEVVQAMESSAVIETLSLNWSTFSLDPPVNPTAQLNTTVNYDTGWGFIQGYNALPYVTLSADAGSTQFVPQGNKVKLNATASVVPTGSVATYQWKQISGPHVALTNATTATPYFQAGPTDTYAFEVRIHLDNGRVSAWSAPASVTVTGSPGPGGGGGAIGLGVLLPGFMLAGLRRRRKH